MATEVWGSVTNQFLADSLFPDMSVNLMQCVTMAGYTALKLRFEKKVNHFVSIL